MNKTENERYNNYHSHKHYSNLSTQDVIMKPDDYMNRMKELGHTVYSTVEHGSTGNVFEAKMLCNKNGFKMVVGCEAYYVDDRFEKDRSNNHLIILCKNTEGWYDLNRILSESSEDENAYYYKVRIDKSQLLSLNPNNVVVTTACISSRMFKDGYEDNFLIPMINHFKDNFYLEIQSHTNIKQVEYNRKILEVRDKYELQLIHANDSHYMYPEQHQDRLDYISGHGINYPEEEGFISDYPDYETILKRYKEQGVISETDVKIAIKNTLILDDFENININNEPKVPNINKGKDTKHILKEIITKEWVKKRDGKPKDKWEEYKKGIRFETNEILKSDMENYFIFNYSMVDKAINDYGGLLTNTGRGSGGSYIVNNLMNFTQMDRMTSHVPLYATRFMTATRILESKSLPDFDFNIKDQEPFVRASKDLLGEHSVYPMVSYGTYQKDSAFKFECKRLGINSKEADKVSNGWDNYKDNPKWVKIMNDSKKYIGVISNTQKHSCAYILLEGDVRKEIGVTRIYSKTKKELYHCACIDSTYSDKFNYLKNDYLIVTVLEIIDETCKSIGIPFPTLEELEELLDEKTYSMYELGLTCTLNQVDSPYATPLAQRYKMNTIAEVSNFVAGIRPGFKSLLDDFLDRKPYTTHVQELDDILEASSHRMLYQENIMAYLVWLGIPESETYTIIKKISKKKFGEGELEELEAILLKNWTSKGLEEEYFHATWQVVNDASKYSFNASHSLAYAYDSLYCAYLKSHYPIHYYTTIMNVYSSDSEKIERIENELEHFNIKIGDIEFGYSVNNYALNEETNTIYKGISSMKGFGEKIDMGLELEPLYKKVYDDFFDVLYDINETKIGDSHVTKLIKVNFFKKFGNIGYLLRMQELYLAFGNSKVISKSKLNDEQIALIEPLGKSTAKQIKEFNNKEVLKILGKNIDISDVSELAKMLFELELFGYVNTISPDFSNDFHLVTRFEHKYKHPMITLTQINNGSTQTVKCKMPIYKKKEIIVGDIIKVPNNGINPEGKWSMTESGGFKQSKTEFEDCLQKYVKVELTED